MKPRATAISPYLEPLFEKPDWLNYRKELYLWEKKRNETPIPRAILPTLSLLSKVNRVTMIDSSDNVEKRDKEKLDFSNRWKSDKNENIIVEQPINQRNMANMHESEIIGKKKVHDEKGDRKILREAGGGDSGNYSRSNAIYREVNKRGDKIVNGKKLSNEQAEQQQSRMNFISSRKKNIQDDENLGNVIDDNLGNKWNSEHCGKNFYLDGKDTRLMVVGVTENEDLPNFPISQETTGIVCLTPENSDENFFAALNIDTFKKSYPRGRENLSRNWQEWFRNVDEEFIKVEKEADELIKSFEGTLKLMGPEIVCDSCCSCRQTRKANVKYHRTKTPRMVIDSLMMDGKQNKYVVGSLSMNSPAPSPSESTSDIPEIIESHDKITKRKIISSVIDEKGETNYYISGMAKEIEHVPRKIISNSKVPKTIKNVPPCGCAIEKIINEGLLEVTSDDNIPWTKNGEECIGQKYRPHDIGAISCRDYPNDKSCRRNPFKKKIDEKIMATLRERDDSKKVGYPPEEKKMYSIAAFQPCGDEDGMAICGGPWGALNIPDEEEIARREAEAKLIRESPPCGDKPGRSVCGAPFGTRHPIPKKPKKEDEDEEDEDEVDEEEEEAKKKRSREPRKKVLEAKIESPLNRDKHCWTVAEEDNKFYETSALSSSKMEHYRMARIARSGKKGKSMEDKKNDGSTKDGKNGGKKDGRNEAEEMPRRATKKLKDQWNRMKIMSSKFISSTMNISKDQPSSWKRQVTANCRKDQEEASDKETPEKIIFGQGTESERALLVEKTRIHLAEPNDPVEMIPLRSDGKPCECRENRNAKKTLLYNVGGIRKEGKGKRDEMTSPLIEGLIYITPTPSLRNSEEYIPEYELRESSYEKCSRQGENNDFKYIEKYLGPKSLMVGQPKDLRVCGCSTVEKRIEQSKDIGPSKIKEATGESEKKLSRRSGNEDLAEFYSRCRDNVPCWLRCVEFSNDGCCANPRGLRLMKPVCECKYERKIVKREEEKKKWLDRQERLRTSKKQATIRIDGLSRPIETQTNLIISEVKRNLREGATDDGKEIEYCIDGVKQDRVMVAGEEVLMGIAMHTPLMTPEPSKPDIKIPKEHRHWSPIDLRGGNIVSGSAARPEESPMTNSKDRSGENEKTIDVLYQSAEIIDDQKKFGKINKTQVGQDEKSEKEIQRIDAKDNANKSGTKNVAIRKRGKDNGQQGKKKNETPQSGDIKDEVKKLRPVSSVQQLRERKKIEQTQNERKKSVEKNLENRNRSNVTMRKVAGSISQREKIAGSNKKKKEVPGKIDFKQLLQRELEQMANEGFLFAKLPMCHLMPQLQYWIMYRKGIVLPPEERKNLVDRSEKIWKSMEKQKPKKIEAPTLEVSDEIMKNLNWNKADEVKREIASKRALFYSNLRKSRVLKARTMWGLMEFGKFPSVSFKRAFFTYQPCKESDGFVFKPWEKE